MPKKQFSSFVVGLWVMSVITDSRHGLSVGEVAQLCPSLSKTQVKLAVDTLERDGYLSSDTVPWGRTGKIIYKTTEYAAIQLSGITRKYHENYNS